MNREKLLEAMREAASAEFAAVPAEEDIEWAPSSYFRQHMEALVRREARFLWRPAGRRLILVAALIALFLMSFVTAGAFQEPKCRLFTEVTGDYLVVSFGERKPGDTSVFYGPCEPYTLAWLPEGYEETSFTATDCGEQTSFETVWTNEAGETIVLSQSSASMRIYLSADKEFEMLSLGEDDALVNRGRDYGLPYAPPYTDVYWASGQYAYALYAYSDLDSDTILNILASLQVRSSSTRQGIEQKGG